MNGLSQATFSAYLPLTGNLTVALETSLPGNPVLTENVTVIQGLGIIFYELDNGEYYPLVENRCMQIVNVF